MKITRKAGKSTETELVIAPDVKELESLKSHVLGHFKTQVKVPGFRSGSAPLALIEKSLDPNALQQKFLEHAVNSFYNKALEVEKLRVIGQPEIKITKFVPYSDLVFEAKLEVLSAITLPVYKKIRLAKKPVNVSAEDVNQVLENLRQRAAKRQAVDRPAKLGDEVNMDFDGYDNKGGAVAGASAKHHLLILGSQTFIPGFEEKMVGVKSGQDQEFKLKFPANYGVKALASKLVEFKVRVHSVSELMEPKLDDSFAANIGAFKNLTELKADIKKQLAAERETQAGRDYENQLVSQIASKSMIDIPKRLIEDELEKLETEEKRNLTFRGQTWDEHLKEEGISADEHRQRQRPLAEQRVKGGLVLNEIAEREKITVSKEEVDKQIEELKTQYKDEQMRSELDKEENRNEIESRLLTEKTIAKLVGYADKK